MGCFKSIKCVSWCRCFQENLFSGRSPMGRPPDAPVAKKASGRCIRICKRELIPRDPRFKTEWNGNSESRAHSRGNTRERMRECMRECWGLDSFMNRRHFMERFRNDSFIAPVSSSAPWSFVCLSFYVALLLFMLILLLSLFNLY